MKHSLLFRVLWFHLNCVLLHRVCWLFLTFVTFPLFLHYLCSVVSLLRQYLVCCDIFKTVFRQRFRTLGNSALQQTNLSKKDKHLGGMGGKIRKIICLLCALLTCVCPCPPQITTVSGNEFLLQSDIDIVVLDWFHAIKNAIDRLVCICFGCYLY